MAVCRSGIPAIGGEGQAKLELLDRIGELAALAMCDASKKPAMRRQAGLGFLVVQRVAGVDEA